jgi:hypothetical protein
MYARPAGTVATGELGTVAVITSAAVPVTGVYATGVLGRVVVARSLNNSQVDADELLWALHPHGRLFSQRADARLWVVLPPAEETVLQDAAPLWVTQPAQSDNVLHTVPRSTVQRGSS